MKKIDLQAYRDLPQGATVTTVTPRRIAKRQAQFVQVPLAAIGILMKANASGKTWAVHLHLLYETWRNNGKPVKLPNGFLDMVGVDRHAKTRALKKLKDLGLISIERPGKKKSPVVTVKVPP
jgi:hypothetical protein